MSTTTFKPVPDTVPAVPQFSYAQAAKGKPQTQTPSSSHSTEDKAESGPKRTVSSDRATVAGAQDKNSAKRTASEGRIPENTNRFEKTKAQSPMATDTRGSVGEEVLVDQNPSEVQKPTAASTSLELGTASTSIFTKDDDHSSSVNGSSELDRDKQSQTSQNGEKTGDKTELGDQRELSPDHKWNEDIPTSPTLKEAPPPTMNYWQQRKEAHEAKRAKQPPTHQTTARKSVGEQEAHLNPTKTVDAGTDIKKQESKKKSRQAPDEKLQNEVAKASNKDRKTKVSADGKAAPNSPNLPPPGDPTSWPTPNTVGSEEKKKPLVQLKSDEWEKEKENPAKSKASGKTVWTQMDFVPTAVFETHIPQSRRGGRGPSGARENPPRGRNSGIPSRGGERSANSGAPSTLQVSADDSKANAGTTPSLAPSSGIKRASSAGPLSSKESRKPVEMTNNQRSKDAGKGEHRSQQQQKTNTHDSRRPPTVPIPATPQVAIPASRSANTDGSGFGLQTDTFSTDHDRKPQSLSQDAPLQSRGPNSGRKWEGSLRSSDISKDPLVDGGREREERAGRGRGNRPRGAANHATFNGNGANGNTHTNGQTYSNQPPYSTQGRSFSNHERHPSQPQNAYYNNTPHRVIRSPSRSYYHSGYTPTNGSKYATAAPHLPNIQTDLANMSFYPPGPQGVMSAIPYNPYEEQVTVWDMVQMQMEYYFSVDNLCKDLFLRKHMDSQGYVFLSVIAGFNRIVALTTDVEIIRYVCLNSPKIDFKPGQMWQDGRDRLRVKEGWKSFVLPLDQRDTSAQTEGPIPVSNQPSLDSSSVFGDRRASSPRSLASNNPIDFSYQSLNAIAPASIQGSNPPTLPNGHYSPSTHPPLSAAVSEFSPATLAPPTRRFASPDPRAQDTKAFTDDEVQKLQILVRQPLNASLPPFTSASSRTFSNGSIDGRNINDELSKGTERQSRPVNGDVFESDRSARSRSPFVVGSPSRRADLGRSPPVFWMKNKDSESALDSFPNELALESYLDFRRDALKEREQSPPGKSLPNMQNLYNFWSHFLIRNFNGPMYEEFRNLALDDMAVRDSSTGLENLIQYYDEALLGHRAILDDAIAAHYVEMVQNEDKSQERPAFKRLRNAWRNGAFNHMNRHKILKVIDSSLREELDR